MSQCEQNASLLASRQGFAVAAWCQIATRHIERHVGLQADNYKGSTYNFGSHMSAALMRHPGWLQFAQVHKCLAKL